MARKNPTVSDMPKVDKHQQMLDDMHSALSTLGDKIRKPYSVFGNGAKLLPSNLVEQEKPEAKAARDHIECLHKAFKEEK